MEVDIHKMGIADLMALQQALRDKILSLQHLLYDNSDGHTVFIGTKRYKEIAGPYEKKKQRVDERVQQIIEAA